MTTALPAQTPFVDASGNLTQAGRQFMRGVAGDASAVGDYYQTARTDLSGGWMVCDGSAVSQTEYAALYALIGAQMGAAPGATFPLPTIPPIYASGGSGSPGEAPILRTWIKAR